MGWFRDLTGFDESEPAVRENLRLDGDILISSVTGRQCRVGRFELVSLGALRSRIATLPAADRPSRISVTVGDARDLHQSLEFAGALFQVASQFNCLEMVNPRVTPEDGVSGYESDHTQGPACAIAAGAATIFRNYFVPIDGQVGQSERRQLDGLAGVGDLLQARLGVPQNGLWAMRNGYALCSEESLELIGDHLERAEPHVVDEIRDALCIGLQWDTEVTDRQSGQLVSQAFCSALPVSYTYSHPNKWAPFARLVLEATYEATLLAAVENARRGSSPVVLITQVGGGAFGNREVWIMDAIKRALPMIKFAGLDVRIVCYGPPSDAVRDLVLALP